MSDNKLQEEALRNRAGSASELENILQTGLHGAPELRRDEKNHFLGEFRERVLKYLTKKQLAEPQVYREIEEALRDPRATKLIIHSEFNGPRSEKYERLARDLHKLVTHREDPEFVGEAALVVAGNDAVDAADITVEDRTARLLARGLPELLIRAPGRKVCHSCYDLVSSLAPEEKDQYHPFTVMDRMFGEVCPGHAGN
jgi:uncharacterized protein YueI